MEELRNKNIVQLESLVHHINFLSENEYSQSLEILSSVSIGQHFRHIIEFYQILKTKANSKKVNYDKRKRQKSLEVNLSEANNAIREIIDWLNSSLEDIELVVEQFNSKTAFRSSLKRELQYVYEHTTHHMAIVKIGLKVLNPELIIPGNFGVSNSTLNYKTTL